MDAYEYCAGLVRDRDRDRYIAGLFAAEPARRHLFALHAFDTEIARIPDRVSDPMPGEIRLQWWRDALTKGRSEGNPVATALIETVRAFALPVAALDRLLAAHVFDLYADPLPTLNDLEGYAGETSSALIQLSALILAGGDDPGTAEIAGHAGVASAIATVLRTLPRQAARNQSFLPDDLVATHGFDRSTFFARRTTPELLALLADLRVTVRKHLGETEARLSAIPVVVRPAFLPLALIEPTLDRMDRPGYDPFATDVELPRWQRQWLIWRAARSGSVSDDRED